ncbi:hypothetical protein CN584_22275 [Bacillus pseudomycoides]|nr:hypothetical protein CON58_22975 [Bacillus pseudomycoides]PEP80363.1 hypothetical protein CN584_22275 [Bacillus pseudomycoides]PGF06613.1 hypothetical protein COM59_23420 [Bacillus pseudomycoides]
MFFHKYIMEGIYMMYFQYKIEGIEGLCNQLMAIFRTIGEALFYSNQGQSVGIILKDVQTRTSVNFDTYPYFKNIKIDSYVNVNELATLLTTKNIVVRRCQEENLEFQNNVTDCRRFSNREMLADESKNMGLFIAKSFPFAKKIVRISSFIIGLMSFYPQWKAIHLRIEGDLTHIPEVQNIGLDVFTKNEIQKMTDSLTSTTNLSAIYLASGIQENEYITVVDKIKQTNPHLVVLNKKNLLKKYPEIRKEFDSLCLEEQALVDWLVCLGAPFFAGSHASSFSYLAGYMRYYRGFNKETTDLFPEYQPFWDKWFPCI